MRADAVSAAPWNGLGIAMNVAAFGWQAGDRQRGDRQLGSRQSAGEDVLDERRRRLEKARHDISRKALQTTANPASALHLTLDRSGDLVVSNDEIQALGAGALVGAASGGPAPAGPSGGGAAPLLVRMAEMAERFGDTRGTSLDRFIALSDLLSMAQDLRCEARDMRMPLIQDAAGSLVDLLRQMDCDSEAHLLIARLHIDALQALARQAPGDPLAPQIVASLRRAVEFRVRPQAQRRSA